MSIGQGTRVGRLKIRVDRLVYTTITLMSVLVIYDGWNDLSFRGVLAVILGPMLAIFLSHLFGAELGTRVAMGRPMTWRERRIAFVEECRFLVIAIPPVCILVVLSVAGVPYNRIIQVIVLAGVASLGVWGGVAGRRAGLTGWGLVASVGYGLLLGCVILTVQALLQPGQEPFEREAETQHQLVTCAEPLSGSAVVTNVDWRQCSALLRTPSEWPRAANAPAAAGGWRICKRCVTAP